VCGLVGDGQRAADHVRFQGYRANGSSIDLFPDLDRVIDFDAEVLRRTLDLRKPEQKLDCAQIAGAAVDQHGLHAACECVLNFAGSSPNAGHPLTNKPRVLPRCQSAFVVETGEHKPPGLAACQSQTVVDRRRSLSRQFETNRPSDSLLADGRSIHRVAARGNIIDMNGDDVTAAQLAVDR